MTVRPCEAEKNLGPNPYENDMVSGETQGQPEPQITKNGFSRSVVVRTDASADDFWSHLRESSDGSSIAVLDGR